jgi:hypothetical protein
VDFEDFAKETGHGSSKNHPWIESLRSSLRRPARPASVGIWG